MQILREFCVATLAKFPRKITRGEIHSCVEETKQNKKLQPLRFFPRFETWAGASCHRYNACHRCYSSGIYKVTQSLQSFPIVRITILRQRLVMTWVNHDRFLAMVLQIQSERIVTLEGVLYFWHFLSIATLNQECKRSTQLLSIYFGE